MREKENQFWPLKEPDLSELMSEILCKGGQGHRLVFVEYDPATRALYDHVGIPENSNLKLLDNIEKDDSWKKFLGRLMTEHLETFDQAGGDQLKEIMKGFPHKIAQCAKELLKHLYFRDIELVDQFILAQMEKRRTPERFLVCLARSHDKAETEKANDWEWLKNNKADIEAHFHWLLQHVPQDSKAGSSGRRDESHWGLVNNNPEEIKEFIEIAGLEFIFGMRQPKGKIHSRINLYLDTGEYAGQVIAFSDSFGTDDDQKALEKSAIEAVGLLRRILPEVRQARYVDAILSGQSAGVLDHVLVRYLPHMIPLDRFYVRIVNDKFENWGQFFDDKAEIYLHAPAKRLKFFQHFEPQKWKRSRNEKWLKGIEQRLKQRKASPGLEGFVDPKHSPLVFTFLTTKSANAERCIAVVAFLDRTVLHKNFFHDVRYPVFGSKLPDDLKKLLPKNDPVENRQKTFMTHLQTKLAVLLQPRRPLSMRLNQAKEEGKSYEEQYGTAIYGPGYLDLNELDNANLKEHYSGAASEVCKILRHVTHTKEQLVGTLYQPRGYRAIAKIIFDEFFCPLWRHFGLVGNPTKSEVDSDGSEHTPLGSLVRAALDFEDTLRLEGGYREHFVHSYHVFLLGLHLMRVLHLFKKDSLDKKEIKQRMRAWFLTSMYHDIGYPIEKMETIAVQYLQRLRTGEHDSLDGDLAIGVNIGFEKLLASGLLSTRLRNITDSFVKNLFPDGTTDSSCPKKRTKQLTQLEKFLRETYHKDMMLGEYREGLRHTFFQFCMHLALEHGEHGIISSLLFDGGARRSKLVNKASNDENKAMRETVNAAILSHHAFDNNGKWSIGGKKGVPNHWAFLSPQNDSQVGRGCKEIAQSIGWDPAFFIYDLEETNNFRFLGALLILCDVLAQWGRTDETRQQLIYLRRRKDTDPLVFLCYPEIRTDDKPGDCRSYYAKQIDSITGPCINKAGGDTERIVTLGYKCEDPDKEKTAKRCHECNSDLRRAEDSGEVKPLRLTPNPKEFQAVRSDHETISEEAEKTKSKKEKQSRRTNGR